jgi:hypothetical protein
MADTGSISVFNIMRRSSQSRQYLLTVPYITVYQDSSPYPYHFEGGFIDLSNMIGGDVVNIRISKVITSGGLPITHDLQTYNGVPPAGHSLIFINPIPDIYGILIEMAQPAGAFKTFLTEFFYMKITG